MTVPLPDPYPVVPVEGPVDAVVAVPGSKSITNRALPIAALAGGRSALTGALFSDDTARMADSLRRLGIRVEEDPAGCRFEVWGEGGTIPAATAELFVGNSGTTARFLAPILALGTGRYLLDGDARMRERPIQPLLDALGALGVAARSVRGNGCPPVEVVGGNLRGGLVRMEGCRSSQYFTALLQVGPLTPEGLTLEVEGRLVSRPYIDLTASVMAAFGATMERSADSSRMHVPGGQRYRAGEFAVEPDASNASYFLAAAALTGGRTRIPGLGSGSRQGDLRLLEVLQAMGCRVTLTQDYVEVQGPDRLAPFHVDAGEFSDMAQTLYALAVFADGPSEVRGVAHSRLQECDRVAASAAELRRLGQEVVEFPDGLRITPRPVTPAVVRTYHDHRMAMAFALVGLRAPGVAVADPGCTAKTFPDYWARLEELSHRGG